jgi:hypothetical protein
MSSKTKLLRLDMPLCDAGAPTPILLADDNTLAFGYSLANERIARHGIFRTKFSVFKFGYPNDEALSGHRYASLGLGYYCAHEVVGSEWIEEIREANLASFPDSNYALAELRHFIFAFHDTTLEFVSRETPIPELTGDELFEAVLKCFRQ